MPDWKDEIEGRLSALKLQPAREAEIVEELAQHLDDRYEELLQGGATKEEACRAALLELDESDLLAEGLRRVERSVGREPLVPGARRRANMFGDPLARLTLRPAFAGEKSGLHRRRRHRAGFRDRREQRDLQRGQHSPAAPPALQGPRPARDGLGGQNSKRVSARHARGGKLR